MYNKNRAKFKDKEVILSDFLNIDMGVDVGVGLWYLYLSIFITFCVSRYPICIFLSIKI